MFSGFAVGYTPPLDNLRNTRNTVRMGQIRLHISDETHKKLKAAAALEGVTLQQLVERLLTEGLSTK